MSERVVLVVDDEEEIRDLISFHLSDKGLKTITADSGRSAFDLIVSHKPGVVISDLRMPDGDGFELLRRINSLKRKDPKVIMVTGFWNPEAEDVAIAGAEVILTKPFDVDVLVRLVIKLFDDTGHDWEERRLSPRIQRESQAVLTYKDGAKNVVLTANLLNLGRNGMCLRLPSLDIKNRTTVNFELILKPYALVPLNGKGVISWTQNKVEVNGNHLLVGVEFTDLEMVQRRTLVRVINEMTLEGLSHR